jgi:Tol biopolymer transport system component
MRQTSICLAIIVLSLLPASAAPANAQAASSSSLVAFWARSRIYAIHPNGSGQRTVVHAARRNCSAPPRGCFISAFAWSPDGRRIAFLHGSVSAADTSLYVIRTDGRGERRVAGCGPPWPPCHDVAWSPDSSHIAVGRPDGIVVVSVGRQDMRRLTTDRRSRAPSWSPDGSSIAFVDRALQGVRVVDAQNGHELRRLSRPFVSDPQWTPDGSIVFLASGGRLVEWSPDERLTTWKPGSGVLQHPVLSPDGTRLAYGAPRIVKVGAPRKPGLARPQVWTSTLDGTRRWRVYAGTAGQDGDLPIAASWAPGGKRLAFAADAVYVVDVDGRHLHLLSRLGRESIFIGAEVAWQPTP